MNIGRIPGAEEGGSRAYARQTPDTAAARTERNAGTYVNPKATEIELKRDGYSSAEIQNMKKTGKIQCETCANRSYVDGSNDGGVSFKTPTKINPSQAASAVARHENEHVVRNDAKARREGREVVQSSVRLFTDICTECGKNYVSGGETRTVTKKKAEAQRFSEKFLDEKVTKGVGKNVDKRVG